MSKNSLVIFIILLFNGLHLIAQTPDADVPLGFLNSCYQFVPVTAGTIDHPPSYNMLGGTPFQYTNQSGNFLVEMTLYKWLEEPFGEFIYVQTIDPDELIIFDSEEATYLLTGYFNFGPQYMYQDIAILNTVIPKPTIYENNLPGNNDGCLSFGERLDINLEPYIHGLCNIEYNISSDVISGEEMDSSFGFAEKGTENSNNPYIQWDNFDDEEFCKTERILDDGTVIVDGPTGKPRCADFDISVTVLPCNYNDPNCPPLTFTNDVEVCCWDCAPHSDIGDARITEKGMGASKVAKINYTTDNQSIQLKNLAFDTNISYQIVSIYGQHIQHGRLAAQESIGTSALTAGMYIIQIKTDSGQESIKKLQIH